MGGSLKERGQLREPDALHRTSLQSCSHTAGGSSAGSLDSALAQGLWIPAARSRSPGPTHMNWYDSCLPDNYYDLYNPKEEDQMSADFWKIRACDAESKKSKWTVACENYEMAAQLLKQGLELGAEPREDLESALQDLSFRWKSTMNFRQREVISHGITSHQSEDKNALRPTLASRGINHHLKYRASQEHTDGKLSSVLHASVNSTMPLHEHDCEEYEREKQAVPKDNLATSVEDFYDKGTCMKPSIEVLPSHNHAASGDTANDTVPVANVLLEEVQNGLESENKLDMAKEDNVSLAREIGQEFHDIGLGGEECEEDILCQISRTCFAPSEQIFCKAPESTCESKCGDTTSSPNMSEQTVGGKAATHIKEGSGNWTHQLHTCNATEGGSPERIKGILAILLARLFEVTIVQPNTERRAVDLNATVVHGPALHQDNLIHESSVDTTEVVDRNCKAYSPMSVDETEDDGDLHSANSFFSYDQPIKLTQVTHGVPCDYEASAVTEGILDHMPTSSCYRQAHHITPRSKPGLVNDTPQSRITSEKPTTPVLHPYPFPGCGPVFGSVASEDTISRIDPRVAGGHMFNSTPSPSIGNRKRHSTHVGYGPEGQRPGPYQLTLHADQTNSPSLDLGGPSVAPKFQGHLHGQSDHLAGTWPAVGTVGRRVVTTSATEAQRSQHYQPPQMQGLKFPNETGGKLLARANMYNHLQNPPPFFQPPTATWGPLPPTPDMICAQHGIILSRMHQGYPPSSYQDCWGAQFRSPSEQVGDLASPLCSNPDPRSSMILPGPEWADPQRGEVRQLDNSSWRPQSHPNQSPHIQGPTSTWRWVGSGVRGRGGQQRMGRGSRPGGGPHLNLIGTGWEHRPQWSWNMEGYSNQTPHNHHGPW